MSQSGVSRRRRLIACIGAAFLGFSLLVAVATAVGTHLSFTQSPPNPATAAAAFNLSVHVVDDSSATLAGVSVTLDIDPAHNPGSDVIICSGSGNVVASGPSGDATFTTCRIDRAANGYELRARASGATTVFSTAFDVQVGPAHHLQFTASPAASTQTLLSPQPVVEVLDAGGNLVPTASNAITLAINQHAPQFSCSGNTTTISAVSGVATFAGCSETLVADGYQLTASASGLATAQSPTFNVKSGPAAKLVICWGMAVPCNVTPPAPIQGGTVFPTQPVVRVQDANGNTVATDNTTVVTLLIAAGTPASGGPGTLTCTALTGTVTVGVLQFANCRMDKVGAGYRLNATGGSLASGQSVAFSVVTGPPVALAFTRQPPPVVTARAPFGSNVQVAIVDLGGNTVTAAITATISLTVVANPAGAILTCQGGTTATTGSGVATFTGCSVDRQGAGNTLVGGAIATAPVTSLTPATSSPFNVLAPAAAITLTAPQSVITWGADVSFDVQFGVNGGNKPFVMQVSKDGVSWSTVAGTNLMTDANGHATFTYRPSDNRYYRVSFAGAPDLQPGASAIVRVVVRQTNILRPAPSSQVHGITHGTAITFASTIRPNRPELPQPVAHYVVYQLGATGWSKVLDRLVPASRDHGAASLQITFNTAGRYYVRSQAIPTPFNANSSWSDLVRYEVL